VDVILRRAIDRGELPPDADFDLVDDLLFESAIRSLQLWSSLHTP
jgi:hypothetical protein